MAKLYYARISSVNYKKGTASISIEEHENQVIENIPFMANTYEMPKTKERVAVLLEYLNGDVDKGVILGPIYSAEKLPHKTGKEIFEKCFEDGTSIVYDQKNKIMEITAENVKVKKIMAETLDASSAKISVLDANCNCGNK